MIEKKLLIKLIALLAVIIIAGGWWLFRTTADNELETVTVDPIEARKIAEIEKTKKMAQDNIKNFLTGNIFAEIYDNPQYLELQDFEINISLDHVGNSEPFTPAEEK